MNVQKVLKITGMMACALGLGMMAVEGQAKEPAQSDPVVTAEASVASLERLLTLNQQIIRAYLAGNFVEAEKAARGALSIAETSFGPDHPATVNSLNNLAEALRNQGRYAEAEVFQRRALAATEKIFGSEHPDTAKSLNNLALALRAQGHTAEAEPLLRRALAIREKMLGPEHPDTADSLNNLTEALRDQGHAAEAEPLLHRALAIREKALGPEHPLTAISLNTLAGVLRDQGRPAEAEALHRRVLAIVEKALGPEHPVTARNLDNLALVLYDQGRYAEAEPLHRRVLTIFEKTLGPQHPDTAKSLNNLAEALRAQGRIAEAEAFQRRALAIFEKTPGPEHPDTASSLNNLADVLLAQGRIAEAKPLFRRALAIREKALGPEHPDTASSLNNLAEALRAQGRPAEAEPLYNRALAIFEKVLGPEHPATATNLNNLAEVLAQGRPAEAEALQRRALAIAEKALGPEHPDTARSLNNLAWVLKDQGRPGEAEPLLRRALAIIQRTDTLVELLLSSRNLGTFLVGRGQLQDALPYYRTAADSLDRLFAYTQGLPEEARHTFLGQYAHVYREFLELLLKLHEQDANAGFDREFLAIASRNQSRIFSELLRQGDVSRFSNDSTFKTLKEQRQSLLNQLSGLREKRATIPITAPNAEGQKVDLGRRIDAFAADLKAVEDRLWRDYPRYMELLDAPRPVTVEQLQKDLLKPGEVLLSFVLLPERSVLLAVSRDRFVLQSVPLSRAAVADRVRAIRAPLEQAAQQRDIGPLGRLDPADLHALYRDLIAPVEPVLKEAQRVLVVADGPLYNLPLELLLTAYDEPAQRTFRQARRNADGHPDHPLLGQYAGLPYLVDRYRLTYLPSLAALASQRRYPKPPVPITRYLIAFADPVFGPEAPASAAPSGASTAPPGASAVATRGYSPTTQQALALLTRSSGPAAGTLARLPESAEEARALAAAVPGESRLYLRREAQEHTAKVLARTGQFQGLRYLLFATHGLLGGEFLPPAPEPDPKAPLTLETATRTTPPDPRGQPSLALTLIDPEQNEDGLLTLREVIEDFDLSADLVLLSACNTAGDSAKTTTGEGFAGLTRAFLFAGARHLWVSHWPVDSAAARDLITTAVRAREAGTPDPDAALAAAQQALRTSVIQAGQDANGQPLHLARAHPLFWAPFVTVGD